MFRKIFIVVCWVGVSLLYSADKVVATIGTANNITDADIQAYIDAQPSQYAQFYSSPDGKREILNRLIEERLLAIEAKEKGYAANSEVLKTMEQVQEAVMTNQYIKDSVSKVTVSDQEVSKHYNDNKTKYVQPESIRASHILVDTEDEVKTVQSDLKNGKDFAAAAQEYSTDPGSAGNGGDLGYFTKGQMVEPFEAAAFALKKGESSKTPVQTQFGWHLIKVTDYKPSTQRPLAEVKEDIKAELLREKQTAKLQELVDSAKKKYPVTNNL
ncbi:peptidyl-prolyl cis-trans isomerase C [Candidatus Termititenax persephonae]|uniref:Peptidyl-prolyl cis-trans isomerase C n=1 Tax=Candidatus Termititenax persephonae TaxID=2218525 RepID=A0A388TJH5_9BACT|nr:peptidyl-prolyl cis-trans isomerase C [Candidatus Termititenax persephonae]